MNMIHETAPGSSNATPATKEGPGSTVSLVDVQTSLANLATQVEQLCRQCADFADTISQLQTALASEREKVSRLEAERTQQSRIIAHLWEKAFPPEKAIEELKNYPPLDKCHSLQDLLFEMRELSQAVKEQRAS
jgi:hypothetical protein